MVTSDASWSASFRRIGDLERPDHFYLNDTDDCVFWGEYTARKGYSHSTTNGIITNLKKSPLKKGTAEWRYKEREVERVAAVMKAAINAVALPTLTFVPIPPSKLVGDPEYDDRMLRVARLISPIGARELIRATSSRAPRHVGDNRRDLDELRATLAVNESAAVPVPTHVFLIDDVITTGCSFKVCKEMLITRFPGLLVTGMFVARRALPSAADVFAGFV